MYVSRKGKRRCAAFTICRYLGDFKSRGRFLHVQKCEEICSLKVQITFVKVRKVYFEVNQTCTTIDAANIDLIYLAGMHKRAR